MAVGTKVSYADTTTQIRSVVPEFDLLGAQELPFLKLIAGGGEGQPSLNSLSAPCTQTKYEWMEDTDFSLQTTFTADPLVGGTSLSVAAADVGKINEGMILQIDNEQMLVTAANGSNPLTISRGWGGTTAAAHASLSSPVYVVGRAHKEGTDAPSAIYYYPVMPFNYTQELTDTILLSEIEQQIKRYGFDDAIEFETQKRTRELYKLLERQCFWGKRVLGTASLPGSFGGLETFITNSVNAAAAQLTTTHINSALQLCYNANGINGLPDTLIVGSWVRGKVNSVYGTAGVTGFRDIKEVRGGVLVTTIMTDFGTTLDVVLSPWQDQSKAYLLKRDKIGIGPLQGSEFRREMLAKTGTADKWMISGSYTMEVRASTMHAYIYGLLTA